MKYILYDMSWELQETPTDTEAQETLMRKQLLAKQQELLKLQQQRLELELAEAKSRIENEKLERERDANDPKKVRVLEQVNLFWTALSLSVTREMLCFIIWKLPAKSGDGNIWKVASEKCARPFLVGNAFGSF